MANCLFCAASVPPTFAIVDGKVTKIKNGPNGPINGTPLQLQDGGDIAAHDEIKAFFVLKNILKISDQVLSELLGLCDGESYPEHWVNVCDECGDMVCQFYNDTKNILKLERRLWDIDRGLRWRINESKRSNEDGGGPIWQRIRSEALKDISFDEEEIPNENQQVEVEEGSNPVQNGSLEKEASLDSFPSTPERRQGPFESSDDDDSADNDEDSGYLGSTSRNKKKNLSEKTGKDHVEKDKADNQIENEEENNNLNKKNGESERLEGGKEKELAQNEGGAGTSGISSTSQVSQDNSAIFVDLVSDDEEKEKNEESGSGKGKKLTAKVSPMMRITASTSKVSSTSLKSSMKKRKRKLLKKKGAKKGGSAKKDSSLKLSSSAQEVPVQNETERIENNVNSVELEKTPVQNQDKIVALTEAERSNIVENTGVSRPSRPQAPRPPRSPSPILIDLVDDDDEQEKTTSTNSLITPESSTGSQENGSPPNQEQVEQVGNETESPTIIITATEVLTPTTTTSFPPVLPEHESVTTSTTVTTPVAPPPRIEKEKDTEDKTDKEQLTTQNETVATVTTETIVTDSQAPSTVEEVEVPPNSEAASAHVADKNPEKPSEIQSELLDLEENEHFQNTLNQPIENPRAEVVEEVNEGETSILLNLLAPSQEAPSSENISSSPPNLNGAEVNESESELNSTQSEVILNPPQSSSLHLNHAEMIEAQVAAIITNFMKPKPTETFTEVAQAPYPFVPPQPLPQPPPTLALVVPDAHALAPVAPPPIVVPQPPAPPPTTIVNDVDSNLNLLALVTLENSGLNQNQTPPTPIPGTFSQVQIESSSFLPSSTPTLINGHGINGSANEAEQSSVCNTFSTLSTPIILSSASAVDEVQSNVVQESATNGIPPETVPILPKKKIFLIRLKPKQPPPVAPVAVKTPPTKRTPAGKRTPAVKRTPTAKRTETAKETPVEKETAITKGTLAPKITLAAGIIPIEFLEKEYKRPAILRKTPLPPPKDLTSSNLPPLLTPKKRKAKSSYYVRKAKPKVPRKNWREEAAWFMCHLCRYKTKTVEYLQKHLNDHDKVLHKDSNAADKPTLAESATLLLLPRQSGASVTQRFLQTKNNSVPVTPAQASSSPPPASAPPQPAPPDSSPPQTPPPPFLEKTKEPAQDNLPNPEAAPVPPYTLQKIGPTTFFKCQKCPALKTSLSYLQTHLKLHSSIDPNFTSCEICNYPILTEKLEQHHSLRHPSPPNTPSSSSPSKIFPGKMNPFSKYKCQNCPATFTTSDTMNTHQKLHLKGSSAIVCPEPECGWFVLRERLTHHQGQRHPENHAKCAPCHNQFFNDEEHQEHLKLHEIGHVCEKCGYLCKSLTQHYAWHHPNKKGKRSRGNGKECSPSSPTSLPSTSSPTPLPSSSSSSLSPTPTENVETKKVAKNQKIKQASWKCGKCPAEFPTETALQEHEKKEHEKEPPVPVENDEEDRTECDVCGWWAKNLAKHKAKYHPPKETLREAEASSSGGLKKREIKRKKFADEEIQEEVKKPKKKVKVAENKEAKSGTKIGKTVAVTGKPKAKLYYAYTLNGTRLYKCYQCGTLVKKLELIRNHVQQHQMKRRVGRPSKKDKAAEAETLPKGKSEKRHGLRNKKKK